MTGPAENPGPVAGPAVSADSSGTGWRYSGYAWAALIAAVTAAVILIAAWCLSHGITIVFMHLFYFPIVLLAYRYRYRGLVPAILVSLAYVALVYFYNIGQPDVIVAAWFRFLVFIGIAAVIAFLSEQLMTGQRALDRSEQMYRHLIEQTSEGVWIIDRQYRTTYVNAQLAAMFGYAPGEMIGKEVRSFMPERDMGIHGQRMRERREGKSDRFEQQFIRKDGSEFWAIASTTPIVRRGSVEGAFAVISDITGRRLAEEALRESEERYRLMVERAPVVIFTLAPEGSGFVITSLNPAFEKITGWVVADVIGKPISTIVHPEDMPAAIRNMTGVTSGEQLCPFHARILSASGDYLVGEFYLKPRIEGGNITGILGIAQNVTERMRAEEALAESEQKFREIFSNINDAIEIHEVGGDGLPGKYVEVNAVACRMLGYSREELLEHSPLDFTPGYHSIPIAEIGRQIRTEGHARFETVHRKRDGTMIPVEVNAHHVTLGGRDLVLSVLRDITERKQAEEVLKQINRKLNLLSGITRHDIRNQLLVLRGFLTLAQTAGENTERRNEFLAKAGRAADAIERQIAFTKEYEDLGIIAPAWQDAGACIRRVAGILSPATARIVSSVDGIEVFADPLLEKVFYNLIDNALRYGGPGLTRISICPEESGPGLVIVVEDDGAGIAPDDRPLLFSRGFGKNTGLGLFLSREVLSITGITIAENSRAGAGARFEIAVPKGSFRFSAAAGSPG